MREARHELVSWPHLTLAGWVLLFLLLTLVPEAPPGDPEGVFWAGRATGDAILNFLFFIPVGALLSRIGLRAGAALCVVVGISGTVELLQQFIPGRISTPIDVVLNSTGGTLGFFIVRRGWNSLRHPRARTVAWLVLTLSTSVLVCTALLVRPSFPATTYWGQWSPNLAHLQPFEGTVLDASLGPMPLPSWRLDSSGRARELLRHGAPLRAKVRVGPPSDGLASVVGIADDEQREIVLLGLDGPHLVLRRRLLADELRFDRPEARWWNALSAREASDTLFLSARWDGDDVCLGAGGRQRCGFGTTLSRGWSLLLYGTPPSSWILGFLDGFWLIALFAPVGWWSRELGRAWPALGLPLAALLILPALAGVSATSWAHLGVAVASILAGRTAGSILAEGRPRA